MAYKDILVCLDPTPDSIERSRLAIALAKTHGAGLIGLDVTDDAAFVGYWRDRALNVGRTFEEMTVAAGIEARLVGLEYRQSGPTADPTHCVDLILAPHPSGEARKLVASFVPDQLLLKSGAPTLVLPNDWEYGPVGESVVIAWNASREAARAVHDAMPILERARKVVVFAFSNDAGALRSSAEMVVEHLAHHGVVATLSDWTNTGDASAIEALFASLDTQDSDLIVAGGFGHSRLFEGLFGGVSLDLMNQPVMPMLLSH